jgi:Kef-type K+ transport system membrane component KefB
MSSMAVFVGLLVLAYFGSILMGGRSIRGYGLPSGAEYLLLGFVVGPSVLGVLEQETLSLFDPMAQVGVSWLALVTGLNYAVMGGKRASGRAILGSLLLTTLCGVLVGGAVWLVSSAVTSLEATERLLLAGGAGIVGSETTRFAVRWVSERHGAVGPLSNTIASIADSDELGPVIAIAALFVLAPMPHGEIWLPRLAWFGATLGLGVVLGATCAALIGSQLHRGEAMSFLLGASLLGAGVSIQLGLSGITTMFVLGLALSVASKHRLELKALLQKSEQPVLLPVFLLAGAHVRLDAAPYLVWIFLAALGARILGKVLSGWGVCVLPAARKAGPWLGLGLLSSGALCISMGLAFSLRVPGEVGQVVLALAVLLTLFGELVGPLMLRNALARAGELPKASGTEAPASEAPHTTQSAEAV